MKNTKPPIAKKVHQTLEKHGDLRVDDYYWMKLSDEQKMSSTPDEHTIEVTDYLHAENKYREELTSHIKGLEDQLYDEMIARIKQDDSSVPYYQNGYFYITRYEAGQEYPIHSRKAGSLDNNEEIMLDVNELAKDYEYYNNANRSISPNNTILAYSEDTVSRRQYAIRFKNLKDGKMLEDVIYNTTGSCVWANDNNTIFYTRKDETLRSYKIFKHRLGTSSDEDIQVYHEADDTFNAFVFKTKSNKFIVMGSWATLSQEFHILPADQPDATLRLFAPRVRNLEYSIAHHEDRWYIRTNKDGAYNFKVMTCLLDDTNYEKWNDVIPHREDIFVTGIDVFKGFMVIAERIEGQSQICIRKWDGNDHHIDFGENAFTVELSQNPEFETSIIRLEFTSMITPLTVYDYNLDSRKLEVLKRQEVIGNFNSDDYISERINVKASDGKEIPVSMVYRKGFQKDGSAPLLLYAYGSYGITIDPYFSSVRLSLLDRGFVFAIAHIRGGQSKGRLWYEDGKFLNKKNTFNDYIDVAQYLIDQNYSTPTSMFGMGGSAGGMLMGAVLNMRPDLWKGVIAAVPFVDVVTTMLDTSIPLTTGEYDEWGNPNDEVYYHYMKSYSPYDNVTVQDYPALLITTGYHDSQVQYWEPAKWIAKLRAHKTDNNPLLLYCNMDTGHGGASGRFTKYREVAMEYAFLIWQAGKS